MKNLIFSFAVVLVCSVSYSQLDVLRDTTIKGKVKLLTHYVHDKKNPEVKKNRYDVHYDENGLITHAVRKYDTNEYVMLKRTYDDQSRMTSEAHYGNNGDVSLSSTYEYGEHGLTKETHHSQWGVVDGFTYTYDENGNILKKNAFQLYEGQIVERDHSTYKYNEAGELVSWYDGDQRMQWTKSREKETGIHDNRMSKQENYFDEAGRLIKFVSYEAIVEYEEEPEQLEEMSEMEEAVEMEEQEVLYFEEYFVGTYEYNERGHLISARTEMRDYKTAPIFKYEYDNEGNIISFKEFITRWGEEELKKYWTREIEYYK